MTTQLELVRTGIATHRETRKGHIRFYDSRVANAVGDILAALILERIVYFYLAEFPGKPAYSEFWKFRAPCNHAAYREGDSWIEELNIKKVHQFDNALKTIGTKLKCPSKKAMRNEILSHKVAEFDENGVMTNAQYLVGYERDAQRLTTYWINEELYHSMLQHIDAEEKADKTQALAPRKVPNPSFPEPPQKPAAPAHKVTPPAAAPVVLTREQEINAVLAKYPALDEVQKKGVIEVFQGYKKEELKNWHGLLNSLCQKALQNELSLPVAPIAPAKPKVEKVKPKGRRLELTLKTELMRELQSISAQSDWLIYVSGTQFVQVDNGLMVLVPNDFSVRHFRKHPDLIIKTEAVTGLQVIGVRIGSMGDWDCE